LAIRLVNSSDLLVYVHVLTEAQRQTACQAADASGLYGTRIYVGHARNGKIQIVDYIADGVVANVVSASISRTEALRVMRPGAKALLGKEVLTKPHPDVRVRLHIALYMEKVNNCTTLWVLCLSGSDWILRKFIGNVERLPVDQHLLLALVAPRALLCNEGTKDSWTNPQDSQLTPLTASLWKILRVTAEFVLLALKVNIK
jgi:hypothetical protein